MKMKKQHASTPLKLALLAFSLLFVASPSANASAADACRRLSEASIITGTKVLVIASEGLWSFRKGGATQLQNYRCELVQGSQPKRQPASKTGAFVTKQLLVPIVQKYKNKVQLVVVDEAGFSRKSGEAYNCAKAWMSEARPEASGRKVILVGHSFGGAEMIRLTEALGNTPVAGVLTIDPRQKPFGPRLIRRGNNVARWENYYQKFFKGGAGLPGYPVEGADVNQLVKGEDHGDMPSHPEVRAALERMIGNPPGPLTVAGMPGDCSPRQVIGRAGDFKRQGMAGNKDMESHDGNKQASGITKADSDQDPVPGRVPSGKVAMGGKVPAQSSRESKDGGHIDAPLDQDKGWGVADPVVRADPPLMKQPKASGTKARYAISSHDKRPVYYTGFNGRKFEAPVWWEGNNDGERGSQFGGGQSRMGEIPLTGNAASTISGKNEVKEHANLLNASDGQLALASVSQAGDTSLALRESKDPQAETLMGFSDSSAGSLTSSNITNMRRSPASRAVASLDNSNSVVVPDLIRQSIQQGATSEISASASLFERVSRTTRKHFEH